MRLSRLPYFCLDPAILSLEKYGRIFTTKSKKSNKFLLKNPFLTSFFDLAVLFFHNWRSFAYLAGDLVNDDGVN
jgi:hypothetical protein